MYSGSLILLLNNKTLTNAIYIYIYIEVCTASNTVCIINNTVYMNDHIFQSYVNKNFMLGSEFQSLVVSYLQVFLSSNYLPH